MTTTASGTRDRASAALLLVLTVFFALRPSVDVLATYGVGPNLNLLVGAGMLIVVTAWMMFIAAQDGFRLSAAGVAALA